MKIRLINPAWTTVRGYEDSIRVPFPLGLAYIASYLREQEVDVDVIDALALGWRNKFDVNDKIIKVGLPIDQIADMVSDSSPDVVGISCMFTSQSVNLHETAACIKKIDPDIPVIAGGAHPSSAPQDVLVDKNVDFVVQGEGEHTSIELLRYLGGSRPLSDVLGVYYKENGEIKYNGPQKPILDLDSLPLPAHDLFPMDEYFESGKAGLTPRSSTHKRWMSVITSRGCPFKCNFCSVHLVSGRRWRSRSPKSVVDELEYLTEKYQIEHIFFEDDNLTLDIKRAEEIFEEITKRDLNITWETPNGVRADKLTPELIKNMKKSGCVGLTIAVESGDQDFLRDVINKNLDLRELEVVVESIRKEGIDLSAFYIIGIPGENEESVNKTIRFIRKLAKKGVIPHINIAVPLPGTEMYINAKREGHLIKEKLEPVDYLLAMQKPLLKTDKYDPEKLLSWRRKAMVLAGFELLIHNPSALLSSKTFVRLKNNPLSILKNLKIAFRGTC